jgi:mono/diheme cytochrome c family protein
MKKSGALLLAGAAMLIVTGCAAPQGPGTPAGGAQTSGSAYRGELLYENHCTGCHESIVHIRENRRARSVADVRGWVARWSAELKLNWSGEEIDAVAEFLSNRFYKFGNKA